MLKYELKLLGITARRSKKDRIPKTRIGDRNFELDEASFKKGWPTTNPINVFSDGSKINSKVGAGELIETKSTDYELACPYMKTRQSSRQRSSLCSSLLTSF